MVKHGTTQHLPVARAQKYTIRDLTTGQLFVVDAEPDQAIEALAAPPGSPKAAGTAGLVTEISSGREMSLEEFDQALGLHTALEVCARACSWPLHGLSWKCARACSCPLHGLSRKCMASGEPGVLGL
jgi:hypothetical protein